MGNVVDLVRIKDIQDFQKGQHIVMRGRSSSLLKFLYDHHAIVAGIEVSGGNTTVELIHFDRGDNNSMKIISSTEMLNPQKEDFYKVVYKNPKYSPEEIVQRARSQVYTPGPTKQSPFLKEVYHLIVSKLKLSWQWLVSWIKDVPPSFEDYDLLLCNCEHFCTWCVTGEMQSLQSEEVVQIICAKIVLNVDTDKYWVKNFDEILVFKDILIDIAKRFQWADGETPLWNVGQKLLEWLCSKAADKLVHRLILLMCTPEFYWIEVPISMAVAIFCNRSVKYCWCKIKEFLQ